MENILELKKITKIFPGVKALDQVDFNLKYGEVHAIVGENGAGKSTLVKIITGVYKASSGEIYYEGKKVEWKNPLEAQRSGIAAIYQELNGYPELSVAENIFIMNQKINKITRKIDWKYINLKSSELLDNLNVANTIKPKDIMNTFSIAKKQMVEIARALSLNSKVIIMDEPTSSLSLKEVESLFEIISKLKKDRTTIIIISHKPEDIFTIADRVSVYRDGKYIGTKNIDEINKNEMIKMMVGREISTLYPKFKGMFGKEVLKVENLSKKGVFKDVSFTLKQGEVLGFAGLVGSGRTEVMEAIFGKDPADQGKIFLYGREVKITTPQDALSMGIGFVSESRTLDGLFLDLDITENIIISVLKDISKYGFISKRINDDISEKQVKKLDIKINNLRQIVKTLSGGNQQKVVIGKCLLSELKILILDEPTKGIDVYTKTVIHKLMRELADQGLAIIMVSSELPEVIGMSDNILVMHEGITTGYFSREEANQEKIMNAALFE